MTAPASSAPQSLLPKAERRRRERAALDELRVIASDPQATPATRLRAAKTLLETLKPSKVVVPRRGGKGTRSGLPARTPEELRKELADVQARRARPQSAPRLGTN